VQNLLGVDIFQGKQHLNEPVHDMVFGVCLLLFECFLNLCIKVTIGAVLHHNYENFPAFLFKHVFVLYNILAIETSEKISLKLCRQLILRSKLGENNLFGNKELLCLLGHHEVGGTEPSLPDALDLLEQFRVLGFLFRCAYHFEFNLAHRAALGIFALRLFEADYAEDVQTLRLYELVRTVVPTHRAAEVF
jgi:hypothetical protein